MIPQQIRLSTKDRRQGIEKGGETQAAPTQRSPFDNMKLFRSCGEGVKPLTQGSVAIDASQINIYRRLIGKLCNRGNRRSRKSLGAQLHPFCPCHDARLFAMTASYSCAGFPDFSRSGAEPWKRFSPLIWRGCFCSEICLTCWFWTCAVARSPHPSFLNL